MRRLAVQVIVLAGIFVGLSRLAGRSTGPASGDGDAGRPESVSAKGAGEMSSGPPDLTFYRTLNDGKAAPPGAGPINNDVPAGGTPDSPATEGTFVVQALATRDAATARRLRDRLAARGFPAIVSEDRGAGRPVYRVRAGSYRTRAEAEAAVRTLRQKLHLSPWILQEGG